MQLTKGFEQAACIIALLCTQNRAVPLTTAVIHKRLTGSEAYLRKIMRKLVLAGLVTSLPGNNGGFRLAKDPSDISLLDIVEASEGPIKTYPDMGFIENVFSEAQPIAERGKNVLNETFQKADGLWRDYLAHQSLNDVLVKIIGEPAKPGIDWNAPEKGLTEQLEKMKQRMAGNLLR
ncbi:Rrf2 family transcriptional regulator [Pediococcus cellicola]|uniref:Rrf2 family transcriptional regulator n=1 Tax=Pediococcus cellicola TaxID=319652 RepID=A0A0R2IQW2_9LACO|nr:Rrf2 family transcriptional regulator [Pediococcus cellicola]KRN67134.1 Rrf2 family transcriptional regulator [Pediococcus cellicola]GEL14771.1 Rrf2 family transcriptional regulator [Pediococcus cellicola]